LSLDEQRLSLEQGYKDNAAAGAYWSKFVTGEERNSAPIPGVISLGAANGAVRFASRRGASQPPDDDKPPR
jgi:hypothetical protein